MPTAITHYNAKHLNISIENMSTDTVQEIAGYINSCKKQDKDYFLISNESGTTKITFEQYYHDTRLFMLSIEYTFEHFFDDVLVVYNDEITTITDVNDDNLRIFFFSLVCLLQKSLEFIPDRHVS